MKKDKINALFLMNAPTVLKVMVYLFKKNISFEYITVKDQHVKESLHINSDKKYILDFEDGKLVTPLTKEILQFLKN